MGLLSDPSLTPRSQLGRNLAKHSSKISLLFYIAGLTWFVILAHPDFNHSTYLSENALSPGLVYLDMKQDSSRLAQTFLEELQRERESHKSSTPHAWVAAKMRQIGLETHVHNFTLRYPFAGGKEYQGKNIYGILRAPRISSTEGIVLSVPYRPVTSVHTDISPSVPILLAFADFARRKNYWAKDLIFLVTEQEQLGMYAWLEAYYEGGIEASSILKCGNLPARAGALQAALNLEVQDLDFDYVDVKIEGLNGQLPNLDMFNLVQRITSREGVSSGYKNTAAKKRSVSGQSIEKGLRHMAAMLFSQATGVPNGNHGLFHRYRIESLTLEAVKRSNNGNTNNQRNSAALPMLKVIEGISRSLNNLLERFHQSYFFYILVQNDRFVSIGDYMPCLGLLAGPLFIKAFLLWLIVGDEVEIEDESCKKSKSGNQTKKDSSTELPYGKTLILIGICASLGVICQIVPLNSYIRSYFVSQGVGTATTVTLLLATTVIGATLLPCFFRLTAEGIQLTHICANLSLGVALIVLGLLNFSLGFLIAIVTVPLIILLPQNLLNCGWLRITLIRAYTFILNPLILAYVVVFILTYFQFEELAISEIFWRALAATKDAITYALMDRIIYGNWLYIAISAVLFPIWTVFWTLSFTPLAKDTEKNKID